MRNLMITGSYHYTFPRPSRPDGALPVLLDEPEAVEEIRNLIITLVQLHSALREFEDADMPAVDTITEHSRNVREAAQVLQSVVAMRDVWEVGADYVAVSMVCMVRLLLALCGENHTEPISINVELVP